MGSCLVAAYARSQTRCHTQTISDSVAHLGSAASGKRQTSSCISRTTGYTLSIMLLLQIHFISASCENMIDGKGMLPGDVLTASNGKTVEVSCLKTDMCLPAYHACTEAAARCRDSRSGIDKVCSFTGSVGCLYFDSSLVCCFGRAAIDKTTCLSLLAATCYSHMSGHHTLTCC